MSLLLVGVAINPERWRAMWSQMEPIIPETIQTNYEPKLTRGIFNNNQVAVPPINLEVLGANTEPEDPTKKIVVDLTTQTLTAFKDNMPVFSFLISSGKWNRTPTGTFKVWTKIRSQKMSGGSKELGTYYYLPNVPYILFFYNDRVAKKVGYSIHGTYWHENFGTPMSHGCINMKTSEAAEIFAWAPVGTEVEIIGKWQPNLAKKQ